MTNPRPQTEAWCHHCFVENLIDSFLSFFHFLYLFFTIHSFFWLFFLVYPIARGSFSLPSSFPFPTILCPILLPLFSLPPFPNLFSLLLPSQPLLSEVEQAVSKEMPGSSQITSFLLAGHFPGFPQHSDHCLWTSPAASVANWCTRYIAQPTHMHTKQ